MNKIYKVLIEKFSNLDIEVLNDKDFITADRNLSEALKQFDKLELSEKEEETARHVFEMYTIQSAIYVELAYKKGFEDAVHILKEIGVI